MKRLIDIDEAIAALKALTKKPDSRSLDFGLIGYNCALKDAIIELERLQVTEVMPISELGEGLFVSTVYFDEEGGTQ